MTTPLARGCAHGMGCHTGAVPNLASAPGDASGWLLVEHAGTWSADITETPTLPTTVAGIFSRALALGIRSQLIRRSQRRRTRTRPWVLVGWSAGDKPWLEERQLDDLAQLESLDLEAVAAGERPLFGRLRGKPVVLACTHGKRDACCARLGRPLARALSDRWPGWVWESSHVGGHRFAANLVCLPHGLYYGAMTPTAANAAIDAYQRGEVTLDRYRGRCGIPQPLQAAEHFVRAHTGELTIGGVAVTSTTDDGAITVATLRVSDEHYRVVVEAMPYTAPGGVTCAEVLSTYRLAELERLCEPDPTDRPLGTSPARLNV